jgi:hypothetical protein
MIATLTAPSAKPRGLARAETEDEKFTRELRERRTLEQAQQNKSSALKLERAARSDPVIRRLLDDYQAAQATVAELRAKNSELAAQASLVTEQKIATEQELNGTTANLETAQADVAKLNEIVRTREAEIKKLAVELDAARGETTKVRAELAQALGKKKA